MIFELVKTSLRILSIELEPELYKTRRLAEVRLGQHYLWSPLGAGSLLTEFQILSAPDFGSFLIH